MLGLILILLLPMGAPSIAAAQVQPQDSLALVALYNGCGGPGWTNHANWLTGPVPQWAGVTVTGDRVTRLGLDRNQLLGQLPPELGTLTGLESLVLYINQLSGAIPPELGQLVHLERLWLSDNQFTGPLPPELGNLANLTQLELHNNQINGPIPPTLGNLAALEALFLENNQLSGEVPPDLGNLTNLNILTLHQNLFTGALPLSFTNLTNLATFTFNRTSLCEPPDPAFQAWLQGIPFVNSTGVTCTATPTEDDAEIPAAFALDPTYPNPFNPSTTIRYALPQPAAVRLAVYDAQGRLVDVLVEARQPAGRHTATFEAGGLASGVYFARIEAGAFQAARPMLLVK